jgi:ubiquinone/menaquinone biosynthesis C-methylase UbiE
MSVTHTERRYIPAAGQHWSLPLYDPITKLIGVDRARKALIDQAQLRAGYRVLDVGCGTGTLAVLIARMHPDVQIAGLDPDAKALARGRRKAERAGAAIQLDRGFSDAMPYADASFDRVFSSFMFHHLDRTDKQKMLAEVRRVLKPGGRLELLDFQGPDVKSGGFVMRMLHSHRLLEDNAEARVLALLGEARLGSPRRVGHRTLLVGHAAYYQASRPL